MAIHLTKTYLDKIGSELNVESKLQTHAQQTLQFQDIVHLAVLQQVVPLDFHVWHTIPQTALPAPHNHVVQQWAMILKSHSLMLFACQTVIGLLFPILGKAMPIIHQTQWWNSHVEQAIISQMVLSKVELFLIWLKTNGWQFSLLWAHLFSYNKIYSENYI